MSLDCRFIRGARPAYAALVLLCGCSVHKTMGGEHDTDPPTVDAAVTSISGQDSAVPACPGKTLDSCSVRIPSFSREVYPIIISRCENCHSPANDAGLWPLVITAAISQDTRNKLFFKIEVPRKKLWKAWHMLQDNPLARIGFSLSFVGLIAFPVAAVAL